MPATPTYGWPTPADTDYVKDGAAAMRSLADAIEATMETKTGDTLAGYRETLTDLGAVSSSVVLDFATANVFRIDPAGACSMGWTGLPAAGVTAPGTLIVANDAHALSWPVGTKFAGGAPPELSGETWLSLVAVGSTVTVGVAWTGVV